MSLKRILILITCILIPTYSAVADCTIPNGGTLPTKMKQSIKVSECEKLKIKNINCSDTWCDLVCNGSLLTCQKRKNTTDLNTHNTTLQNDPNFWRVNSVASVSDSTYVSPEVSGQYRGEIYTKNEEKFVHTIAGYKGDKVTVVDACEIDNNRTDPKEYLRKSIDMGSKKIACIRTFEKIYLPTPLAVSLISSYTARTSFWGYGNIEDKNCVTIQTPRTSLDKNGNVVSSSGHDRYIRCKTSKNVYVEFKFGDMNKWTALLNYGDVAKWLCPEFGMNYMQGGNEYAVCNIGTLNTSSSGNACQDLNKIFADTKIPGFQARQIQNTGHCVIYADSAAISSHAFDDTYLFQDVTLKPSALIKKLLVNHYASKYKTQKIVVGQPMFYMPWNFISGNGSLPSASAKATHAWPIQINGKNYVQVFRKINPADMESVFTGAEEIKCVLKGGLFDGQRCWLITERQCDEMHAELRNAIGKKYAAKFTGAKYKNESCVMIYSQSKKNEDVARKVGSVVAGVVLTALGTVDGGSTAPIGVVIIADALGTTATAVEAARLGIAYEIDTKTLQFLKDSSKCIPTKGCSANSCVGDSAMSVNDQQCLPCSTCNEPPTCAKTLFEDKFKEIISLRNSLTEGQIKATDVAMQRLLGFMPCDPNIFKQYMDYLKDETKHYLVQAQDALAVTSDTLSIMNLLTLQGVKDAGFAQKIIRILSSAQTGYNAASAIVDINNRAGGDN